MSLSTNSVFHFTNTKTNLKGILKSNFKIKYCYENIHLSNVENKESKEAENFDIQGGIPMVSFCDIPLSQIKDHVKKYGQYSIGLKKEWARKNKLNPVLYFEQESHIAHQVLDTMSEKFFERKILLIWMKRKWPYVKFLDIQKTIQVSYSEKENYLMKIINFVMKENGDFVLRKNN